MLVEVAHFKAQFCCGGGGWGGDGVGGGRSGPKQNELVVDIRVYIYIYIDGK